MLPVRRPAVRAGGSEHTLPGRDLHRRFGGCWCAARSELCCAWDRIEFFPADVVVGWSDSVLALGTCIQVWGTRSLGRIIFVAE